jgi:hypothetical protein
VTADPATDEPEWTHLAPELAEDVTGMCQGNVMTEQ